MYDSERIKNLFEWLNITDPSQVTSEDFFKILKMTSEGKIDKETLKLLIKVIPHIATLLKHSIEGIKQTCKSAQKSQEEVLKELNQLSEALNILAKNVETDESRLKLAEMIIEIAKIVEKINEDNNGIYIRIAAMVGSLFGLVIILLINNRFNAKII